MAFVSHNVIQKGTEPSPYCLNKWLTNLFNIKIQTDPTEMDKTITHFTDDTKQWAYHVESEPDSTFSVNDNTADDLKMFFSRPIKIREYQWPVNSVFFEKFNPWSDFFRNKRVANRLTNFMNLRCKLCVRVLINGTIFHYGRAMLSYNPLHIDDNVTVDRAFFVQDLIAASQRPKIFIDPTLSQGGDICLPFFWYNNALNIPVGEFDKMGEMILQQINILKHANGSSDTVDISIYAWAEDVHLSIPTSADMDALVPQSGDEYGQGIVSKPMGVLAKTAGALRSIPMISAYARAVEMAAGSMSSIATMFGYSRPNVVADIEQYKPMFLGNMANTRGADTAIKLALDPKQELTIDPRTMGLGSSDEMSIASIAKRESYLTQFPWTVSSQPETILWTSKVSPVLWDTLTIGSDTEYHFPATCFATMPFLKWRGSMKFRFQVVCSNFHKGRLKIVYDPYAFESNEYNTNFTHVVDISKDKDFTVEIGWGHPLAYCQRENPTSSPLPFKTTGTYPPSTVTNQ